MDGWVGGWVNVGGWMGGWMDRWLDEWMGEWVVQINTYHTIQWSCKDPLTWSPCCALPRDTGHVLSGRCLWHMITRDTRAGSHPVGIWASSAGVTRKLK